MIAGARTRSGALTVDYADVLRQAVENERWRVLRDVTEAIDRVPTEKPIQGRGHGVDQIEGRYVKRDILDEIRRLT